MNRVLKTEPAQESFSLYDEDERSYRFPGSRPPNSADSLALSSVVHSYIDMDRLHQINEKRRLSEQDLVYLKEHLPPNIFESYVLDRATEASPRRGEAADGESRQVQAESQAAARSVLSNEVELLEAEIGKHMKVRPGEQLCLNVLVAGAAGVGKTSFVRMMTTFVDRLDREVRRSARDLRAVHRLGLSRECRVAAAVQRPTAADLRGLAIL